MNPQNDICFYQQSLQQVMHFRRNFHQMPYLEPIKHLNETIMCSDLSLQMRTKILPNEDQLTPWDTQDAPFKPQNQPMKYITKTPNKKPIKLRRNLSQMEPSPVVEFPCYKLSRTLLAFNFRDTSKRDPQIQNNRPPNKQDSSKSPRVRFIERRLRIRDILIQKMRKKQPSLYRAVNKLKAQTIDCDRQKKNIFDNELTNGIMLCGATLHNFRKE